MLKGHTHRKTPDTEGIMTELEAAQRIISAAEQAWVVDKTGRTSIHFIQQYMAISLRELREQMIDQCADIVESWDMQGSITKEMLVQHIRNLKGKQN
jgi:hypothetical protein